MERLAEITKKISEPWIFVIDNDAELPIKSNQNNLDGVSVFFIDGNKCKTKFDMFFEISQSMNFPSYFGSNWMALDECITDLEWLDSDGYAIFIKNAFAFLPNDDEYETFVRIMNNAGLEWSKSVTGDFERPPRPFHVILLIKKDELNKRNWRVKIFSD